MAKILFIPRSSSEPSFAALFSQAEGWSDRGFEVVVYGTHEIASAHLSSADTEIYIFGGHCSASQAYLGWPGNNDNRLDYSEVVTRLLQAGLIYNRQFAGHIKVYSCQSAENERMNQAGRPEGKSADLGYISFAQKFLERLRDKGVSKCTVWGYSGNISTAFVNRFGKEQGDEDGRALRATDPAKGRSALMYSRSAEDAAVRIN